MKEVIGIRVAGKIFDTQSVAEFPLEGEPIFFDNSEDSLSIIRHSCAHLMAHALSELYPDAKFFVGPVVDEGFYYDFKTSTKISEADLILIEEKMRDIANRGLDISKYKIDRLKAIDRFKDDELKLAVIDKIKEDQLSVYVQGEFEDLCRGPHLPNTRFLGSFKLTRLAGAYLGGDENSEMLTRIYGIAFADKRALEEYLHRMEEAKRRDHRKLGMEMGLFTFDEDVGAGLPIWLPMGSRLRQRIENLLTKALIAQGYNPVIGPQILKSNVWKISGHYDNYGENMYFTKIDEVEYGIKPMNCVGHIKVYQSQLRSYRDLPLRFYEYGVVHRHEKSGVLHGLLRVREFTQDDAHIFCSLEQIRSEVRSIIAFTSRVMQAFGFSYEMELATRPKKFIGPESVWESATQSLVEALRESGVDYKIDEEGGAFYGPKIDIKITDAIGRKWQCGTVQIDMNLPDRFMLGYMDENNRTKQPVMIHRAILGSFERFCAILTEHFSGEFPFFIAPIQVLLIPISENEIDYALLVRKKILDCGAYAEVMEKNDSLNKRIRIAERSHVPMIVIIGQRECASGVLSVRDRREKKQYQIEESEFLGMVVKKMNEVSF